MSVSQDAERLWGYWSITPTVYGLLSGIWGLETQGLENVPRSGRVIVAVNHVSWMDPPVAACALYRKGRFARFLAKQELFRNPLAGWFLRGGGAIPLDRSRGDVGAIRAGLAVLEAGGCMVLFPEGTRSRTGAPGRPRSGVGFLAHHARAPVVPARVRNTERFPKLVPMGIKFGPAMSFAGDGGRESVEEFARRVMEAIWSL